MTGPWQKYGDSKSEAAPNGPWAKYAKEDDFDAELKKPPAERNAFAVANDTVIELANTIAGGVGAVADFVSPGNSFSRGVDEFVKGGEKKQSDLTQADRDIYQRELGQADSIGGEIAAVGRHLMRSPLQVTAQALGSFVGPGLATSGTRAVAGLAGLGAKGAGRAGLAAGAGMGAALGGGDAAGSAYELVQEIPEANLLRNPEAARLRADGMSIEQIRKELGERAGRDASLIPALLGAASGVVGAERILATGRVGAHGLRGVAATGLVEAGTEAVEEGVTQYEGRRAASKLDKSIDPSKGVAGAAAMGAVMGGVTGAGVHVASGGLRNTRAEGPRSVLPEHIRGEAAARGGDPAEGQQAYDAAELDVQSMDRRGVDTAAADEGGTVDVGPARVVEVQRDGQSAIWQNADHDQPVTVVRMEPDLGPDGRQYARVRVGDRESYVPADELVPAPAAADFNHGARITWRDADGRGRDAIFRGYDNRRPDARGRLARIQVGGRGFFVPVGEISAGWTPPADPNARPRDALVPVDEQANATTPYVEPESWELTDDVPRAREAVSADPRIEPLQGTALGAAPAPEALPFQDYQPSSPPTDAAGRADIGLTPDVERAQVSRTPVPVDVPRAGDIDRNGRPFVLRSTAARAAREHGAADVVRVEKGFVVRPRAAAAVGAEADGVLAVGPSGNVVRPEAAGLNPEDARALDAAVAAAFPVAARRATQYQAAVGQGTAMQNRDRSRPASVEQMNRIANAPDYDRLGVGRSPNEAAPLVSVAQNAPVVPETDMGRADRVTLGDGSKVPFRYAVIEADRAVASHAVDGSRNAAYYVEPSAGTIRALNNGRTAGIQTAYRRGRADDYRQAMMADAQAHGVSPDAIAAKQRPMLVRIYDDAENARPNIGALSNPTGNLGMSATEQAQQDAGILDVADLVVDEDGAIDRPDNRAFLDRFARALRAQGEDSARIVDGAGAYSRQFIERARAAVFARAYASPELTAMATESADPDVRNVLNALTMAAPDFARAADISPDLDIRPQLASAVQGIRDARARGLTLNEYAAQSDMFGRDEVTDSMMELLWGNIRSPRRMGEGLREAARLIQNEAAQASTGDMFGRTPLTPASAVSGARAFLEDRYGSQETRARPEGGGLESGSAAPGVARGQVEGAARRDGSSGQPDRQRRAAAGESARAARPIDDAPFEARAERAAAAEPAEFVPPPPRARSGVRVEDVQRLVDRTMRGLPGADLRVSVVQTVADIPRGIIPSAGAQGAYYRSGDVYLVADNLPNLARAQQVLAHEVVGHYGVERLLGNRFPEVLADVRRLTRVPDGAHVPIDADVGHPHYATMEAVGMRYPDLDSAGRAAEVLARLAETNQRPHFMERVYGMIRAALRRMGFDVPLRAADIRQMVIDARRNLERPPRGPGLADVRAGELATEARGGRRVRAALANAAVKRVAQTFDQARAAAKEFQGRPLRNTQTGLEATVSRNNLDKMLSGKAVGKSESPAAHSLAVANLDQLFERARWGWKKPDRNSEGTVAALHRFFAPIVYEGRAMLAKLTVKETTAPTQPNPLYTVEAVEFQEEGDAERWMQEAARADGIELSSPGRGSSLPANAGGSDTKFRSDAPEGLPRTATWVTAADAEGAGETSIRSVGDVENLAQQVEKFNRERGVDASGGPAEARGPEAVDLPDAVIGHALGAAGSHPDHMATKAGDADAAVRLVGDLVTPDLIDAVRSAIGDSRPTVVPVHAYESTGENQIPATLAGRLASALQLPVNRTIVQSVRAKRTELGGLDRLFRHPEFEGTVERGRDYLLVDDTLTQGGTLASLASHIQRNGGRVVGVFALTGKQYSAKLSLSPQTLAAVRERYGDLESSFRAAAGRGFDSLTESEGRYLARARAPEPIRDRIAAEGAAAHARARSEGVGRPARGVDPDAPAEARGASAAVPPPSTASRIEDRLRDNALGKIGAFAKREPLAQRLKARAADLRRNAVQGVFDQFVSLAKLDQRAYMQARLSKGTDGAVEAAFTLGPVKLTDGALDVTPDGKGLAGHLQDLKGEHDYFLAWVAGNRADRLAQEWTVTYDGGTKVRFANEALARAELATSPGAKAEPASRERLFTPEDIEALKRLATGKMRDGRSRADVYGRALRALNRYQTSVLDVATEAGLIDGNSRALWESEFYVPFYRVMEEGDGTHGPAQIGGLVGQRAFAELKGGKQQLGDLLGNTLSNWSHLLSASMKNMAAQRSLNAAVKLGVASEVRAAEKGSVRIMDGGRERHFLVEEPQVLDALQSLNYTMSQNLLMKAGRALKQSLTVGVTISPTFRVRNLARDVISAIATNEVSYNPVQNVVEGWRGTAKGSDTYARLLAGGGAVRFGSLNDGEQARNAKRLINAGLADRDQILDSTARVQRFARGLWDAYAELGDRAETVNRATIYNAARRRGADHLQASYEARDLMDFTMTGKWEAVRTFTQLVPFMNARLQGMYKLGRATQANPYRFAAVTGAVGMASALLYLSQRDDDEYRQLPDWVRNTYWPVRVGEKFVYIPKPFEVGALGSVIERGTELAVAGNDYQAKDFAKTLQSILADQLSMDLTPQAIKPLVEAKNNRDGFRDSSIDTPAQLRMPAAERYTSTTSAAAIAAGQVTGASPQRIEHLVRGYFGWLGTQALNVADLVGRSALDMPANPRRDMTRVDNWPFAGDFVKEAADPTSSKYIQRFYDVQREIDEVYALYSEARKAGEVERARELAAGDELKLRGLYQSADKSLTDLGTEIRRITNDSTMSAEEKALRMDPLYRARNRITAQVDQQARGAAR